MVALMLVSVGLWLPGAGGAISCCFPRPDFQFLGPPPRPPGLSLPCNGTECCNGFLSTQKDYTGPYEATSEIPIRVHGNGPVLSSSTVSGADPSTAAPAGATTPPPPFTAFAASASVETSSGPPLHAHGRLVPPHPPSTLVTAARQPPPTTTTQFSPAASTTNTQTSSVASATPGAGTGVSSSSSSQTLRSSHNVPNDGLATPASAADSGGLATTTTTTDPPIGGANHIGDGPILTNDHLGFMQSSRPVGVSSGGGGSSADGGTSSLTTANPSLQTQTTAPAGHRDRASLPLTTSNLVPAATTSKTPTHQQHRTSPAAPTSYSHSSRPLASSSSSSPPAGRGVSGSLPPPPARSSNTLPTPHSHSPLPVGPASSGKSVTSSSANQSAAEDVTSPGGSDNVTAGPYGIGRSTGKGGLAAGELAALGLGIVLVVLILLLLSLYWKKRYKGRVNPTPMKEETNYLHNYRVRGWTWRPAPGPRGASPDDVERSDDKKALITSPVTSHLSLSSGSLDAGYGGGDTTPQQGGGPDPMHRSRHPHNNHQRPHSEHTDVSKYVLKTESSTSSGIGLSQGDLQEEGMVDDLVSYNPDRMLHIMNGGYYGNGGGSVGGGGTGGVIGRTPQPVMGKQVPRSVSNNALGRADNSGSKPAPKNGYFVPPSHHHHRHHVHKSASSPNRLNRPASYDSIAEDAGEDYPQYGGRSSSTAAYRPLSQMDTGGGGGGGGQSVAFPILEAIHAPRKGPDSSNSASKDSVMCDASVPAVIAHPASGRNSRLDSIQSAGSPDPKQKKKRKKRRHVSRSESDSLDQVAMDTIPKSNHILREKDYVRNGESVA